MKPFFLTDFDNSVLDTRRCHSSYINNTYGIKSIPEDFVNNASFAEVIKKYNEDSIVTDNEVLLHLGECFHSSFRWHREILPIDKYVARVLFELSKKYNVVIATKRPDFSAHVVRELLEEYFPKCISFVHFVNRRISHNKYEEIYKPDFVRSLGADRVVSFVDDSTEEIKMMQDLIPSHLFDPWFLFKNEINIKNQLVHDWDEIGDLYL